MASVGRVTLQTVADKVGVSRMTVSNAFSRPDQLSASLRREDPRRGPGARVRRSRPGGPGSGPWFDRRRRGPAHLVADLRVQRRRRGPVLRSHRPGARRHRARADPAQRGGPQRRAPGSRRGHGRRDRLRLHAGDRVAPVVAEARPPVGVRRPGPRRRHRLGQRRRPGRRPSRRRAPRRPRAPTDRHPHRRHGRAARPRPRPGRDRPDLDPHLAGARVRLPRGTHARRHRADRPPPARQQRPGGPPGRPAAALR